MNAVSRTKTYRIWAGIKTRCFNENDPNYRKYGARGITMCGRWLTFNNFLADMGECPDEMSIERINNEGDYEPGNCKWATDKEQQRNKRNTRWVTIDGVRKSLIEWTEDFQIKASTVCQREAKGWNIVDAIITPAKPWRKPWN